MSIGSWIGDRLNMRVPILLATPGGKQQEVKRLLVTAGYTDVRYGKSGNRGLLGVQRWLDVFPPRAQHWDVYYVLIAAGYTLR